jgi:transposase-like protein
MNLEMTSLDQFYQQFNTEDACAEYLFHAKWPNGFSCPRCEHRHAYKTGTRRLPLYECRHCGHQSSLIAGTILEGSRTELRKWLLAFYLISRSEQGTNAVELARTINVTYKTAWLILRKIRHAISAADGETLLSGIVRVNTAVYGKPYNSSIHLHPQEHPILVGSSLDKQGGSTFIKMKLVAKSHMRDHLVRPVGTLTFTKEHVEPQTTHIEFVIGRFSPNRSHRLLAFVSEACKWINKTFHGLGHKHLQAYLDEFTYRLNLSIQNIPIFNHLTRLCAKASSVTYSYLTRTA